MHLILPDEYKKALAFVKAKCPEAVLAGGCLRDLHTGKEVKDLDIFIIAQPNNMDGIDFGGSRIINVEFDDYDGMGDICYVEQIELDGVDIPVQVIHLYPEPEKDTDFFKRVIERIDLGFCQAGYNGEEFRSTDLYVRDMKHKTITVNPYNPEWNEEATRRRLERLAGPYWCDAKVRAVSFPQAKYHDWRVIGG